MDRIFITQDYGSLLPWPPIRTDHESLYNCKEDILMKVLREKKKQHLKCYTGVSAILFCIPLGCKTITASDSTSLLNTEEQRIPRGFFPERNRSLYESRGSKFMVVTQGEATTRAAISILNKGGNIFDAAVTASFTIAVERPQSTGIGGGGFMVLRRASTGKIETVDFREVAPQAATKNMFIDDQNKVIASSTYGGKSSGVPGMVAGVLSVHQRYGQIKDLNILLQPAIELAEKGLHVYTHLYAAIADQKDQLKKSPEASRMFLSNGQPPEMGALLKQPNLAKTLRSIAKGGVDAFYKGDIARLIVAEQKRTSGLITLEDLAGYRVHIRAPVQTTFKNFQVYSMPPPSSGGTHVLQMLNIIGDQLKYPYDPLSVHKTASAMQIAYRDRAEYLGDPDFVEVPVDQLTSPSYAQKWSKKIGRKALKLPPIGAELSPLESTETTHFTIADSQGNVVSSTQTINGWFGSGVAVEGAGFFMNNEMDDFSAKPGVPNKFGVIGGTANAIAPKKRPLSSMSPTLVMSGDKPVLALGSPAGSQIINCVLLTTLNYLHYNLPLWESVTALRYHHQWVPDKLIIEKPGLPELQKKLEAMGHPVTTGDIGCKIQAIAFEKSGLLGVSDPRGEGLAAGEGKIPTGTGDQRPQPPVEVPKD